MALNLNSDSNEGITEINITPFVDIMLVLLIIFMISTPAMLYRGLKIALPTAATAEDMSHVTLKIALTKDGQILLDNKSVSLADLKKALQKMKEHKVEGDALISADKEVMHGKVMEISDFLRTLGVQQVAFGAANTATADATAPEKKTSKAR